MKAIRYFISFLYFDLAKGGALAPLAPSGCAHECNVMYKTGVNISSQV